MKTRTKKLLKKAKQRRVKVPRSDVRGRKQVAGWMKRDKKYYGRKKIMKFLGLG